jgi:DeoR/GlpR family transcriptional regulator of sugar metabolism
MFRSILTVIVHPLYSRGNMKAKNSRLDQIMALLTEQGYLSVRELGERLGRSEMTIRRDLSTLESAGLLKRTFGGAVPAGAVVPPAGLPAETPVSVHPPTSLMDRVDVLIATSVNPQYDSRLLESLAKRRIPIIAESLSIQAEDTVVALDSYAAGFALGQWAGQYARQHWNGRAHALDLTYSLSNTQARSRGFIAGLQEVLPEAELALSINAQSRFATAYQLTTDALTAFRDINIIFAINDTTAWGAIRACTDLGVNPDDLIVLPFGLEGETLKNALAGRNYCPAGLAMFPEIVAPACMEAAIAAYNQRPLPRHLVTPFVILTPETLDEYYTRTADGWQIRWDAIQKSLSIPINIDPNQPRPAGEKLPARVGFIVPFSEHEWYKKLAEQMQSYARELGIGFKVIDADQTLKEEVEIRRRAIARAAAAAIQQGEVVLIDGGPIANYLAEELCSRSNLTVITNSIPVFDTLRQNADLSLILTGGAYRHSSQTLVGPTAEGALGELRADKLFLMVAGVTLDFGLSHTNLSEVTMKQTMIRSAREVILLADHTFFGQESVVQVAPITAVHRLITDDALPASVRLELARLGIQIVLANE